MTLKYNPFKSFWGSQFGRCHYLNPDPPLLSLQWGIFVYLIPINCYWSKLWFSTIAVILCMSVVHFYQHMLMIGYRFCRSVNKTYKSTVCKGNTDLRLFSFKVIGAITCTCIFTKEYINHGHRFLFFSVTYIYLFYTIPFL